MAKSSGRVRSVLPLLSLIVALAALHASCGGDRKREGTGVTPTAPSATGNPATGTTAARSAGQTNLLPMAGGIFPGIGSDDASSARDVVFPPRDEPYDFRFRVLEAEYRDNLRRSATSSFVDIEGTIVWTQEYLRYRVNLCDHETAIQKVFAQIGGAGVQPVCGNAPSGTPAFPPRDQPFNFRQRLELVYRDQLRRGASQTFVDVEGDIVWTQEYLRYRVGGCSHLDAIDRVLTQIRGGGIRPVCQTSGPTTTTGGSTTTTTMSPTTTTTSPSTTSTSSSTTTTTATPPGTTTTSSSTTSTTSSSTTSSSTTSSSTTTTAAVQLNADYSLTFRGQTYGDGASIRLEKASPGSQPEFDYTFTLDAVQGSPPAGVTYQWAKSGPGTLQSSSGRTTTWTTPCSTTGNTQLPPLTFTLTVTAPGATTAVRSKTFNVFLAACGS